MNVWYLEGEGDEFREVVEPAWAMTHAQESGDPAAYAELLAPDFGLVDNRRVVGAPPASRDEVLDQIGQTADLIDRELLIPTHYPRLTHHGLMIHADRRLSTPAGDVTSGQVVVAMIEDRLFTHVEYFDEEELRRCGRPIRRARRRGGCEADVAGAVTRDAECMRPDARSLGGAP